MWREVEREREQKKTNSHYNSYNSPYFLTCEMSSSAVYHLARIYATRTCGYALHFMCECYVEWRWRWQYSCTSILFYVCTPKHASMQIQHVYEQNFVSSVVACTVARHSRQADNCTLCTYIKFSTLTLTLTRSNRNCPSKIHTFPIIIIIIFHSCSLVRLECSSSIFAHSYIQSRYSLRFWKFHPIQVSNLD